jgi:5'-nucleotidase
MDLLLCNDDGIDATGIKTLESALVDFGHVWVVAPETEQSASSHALTMHEPLRVRQRGDSRWSVSGTPADCVYLAIHHLLPRAPDLVLSGINRGSNLGNDVFYSGTVAAAMEACFQGFASVALSLHIEPEDRENHWQTAAEVAQRVVRGVKDAPLPPQILLNVNVPNVPSSALLGLRVVAMGQRHYAPMVDLRTDPRGRRYYWIGGTHHQFEPIEGTDGPAVEERWATVTPFQPDLTAREAFSVLRTWTDA